MRGSTAGRPEEGFNGGQVFGVKRYPSPSHRFAMGPSLSLKGRGELSKRPSPACGTGTEASAEFLLPALALALGLEPTREEEGEHAEIAHEGP